LLTLGSDGAYRWGYYRGYNNYVPEIMVHVEYLSVNDHIYLQASEKSSRILTITKSGIYAEKIA